MDAPVTPKAAVLQALRSGSAHALEISARLAERAPGLTYSHDSVRAALRELERLRLVESEAEFSYRERGGRPRNLYKLSALGETAAKEQQKVAIELFLSGEEWSLMSHAIAYLKARGV